MPGFVLPDYAHATLLRGTAALNCKGGVIGGGGGAARDTLLLGVYIGLHATTAAALTIAGLTDSAVPPTQQPWVLNGQVAIDTPYWFTYPILNEFAAFTFTPSVDALIWVFTRAYTGP